MAPPTLDNPPPARSLMGRLSPALVAVLTDGLALALADDRATLRTRIATLFRFALLEVMQASALAHGAAEAPRTRDAAVRAIAADLIAAAVAAAVPAEPTAPYGERPLNVFAVCPDCGREETGTRCQGCGRSLWTVPAVSPGARVSMSDLACHRCGGALPAAPATLGGRPCTCDDEPGEGE